MNSPCKLFCVSVLAFNFAYAARPVEEPLKVSASALKLIGDLNKSRASGPSGLSSWASKKLLAGKKGDMSHGILATKVSGGSGGHERAIYFTDNGETVLSFFADGTSELLNDAGGDTGFIPMVVKSSPAEKKGSVYWFAEHGKNCASCHGTPFTPIWKLSKRQDFTYEQPEPSSPLSAVKPALESSSLSVFVHMLVKRAGKIAFYKLTRRNPDRFKKYAPLLMRLLFQCEIAQAELTEFETDVRKQDPGLAAKWERLIAQWQPYIEEQKAKNKFSRNPSAQQTLYPLFLIHFLGIPPHEIFLHDPLQGPPGDLFNSMEEFSQLAGEIDTRWGPLGAYGGQNDDVRSYLLAHMAAKIFPAVKVGTFSAKDFEAYAELKPNLVDNDDARETYIAQFPFSVYNLYLNEYGSGRVEYAAQKKSWCDSFTDKNADFGFLAEKPTSSGKPNHK